MPYFERPFSNHVSVPASEQGNSETLLLDRLRNGDHAAFEQVHREYKTRLSRTASRILRNEHAAEDAVQDALILAFMNVKTFDGRSSFYTWLTKIVTNCCLAELRRKRRRQFLSLDEPADGTATWSDLLESHSVLADDLMVDTEMTSTLDAAMRNLRPDQRFILTARSQDDLSFSEIAVRLGISLAAAKSRALRARRLCARNVRLLMMSKKFSVAQFQPHTALAACRNPSVEASGIV